MTLSKLYNIDIILYNIDKILKLVMKLGMTLKGVQMFIAIR